MPVPPPGSWPVPQPAGPAPLHLPQYDASIGQAASRFWRKFAVFSGRASRSEYWWWALISFVVSAVLQLAGSLATGGGLLLAGTTPAFDLRAVVRPLAPALVWSLVVLVPSIALTVRRLHDTNRSGWWYLVVLPGLAGSVLQLVAFSALDEQRLASGDLGGLALGPLVGGLVLSLVGIVGSIALLVFLVLGPDPRGARFDRRG
ncbi:Uncharacterized membrane protein YhaH, DUF805 family [Friedmanniella luteola]|uniref:Uncharacterized membrane protein YhaH, DUF805 family n=1 Tax=Friedmanniella luteola TaxID=546871 RepID=A0A1H1VVV7_9ACTN|nr:DUF805 domain-containing protein [Friedmanniella luteola]SDS89138.1 Uncharacterized membrane protein YhaH, DUF805 family [Friedmanniella luteola]